MNYYNEIKNELLIMKLIRKLKIIWLIEVI